ncbi:MAG: winged helix-turn-helix domain-containing protein [Paludibaculum sp.]
MEPSGPPARKFRFGPFEVDEGARQLCRNGLPVRLRWQSFQVLIRLLESQGRLVTREELRTLLWPAGTFVEFDPALNSIVNRLRSALGRSSARTGYIETVPRIGYRFTGHLLDPVGAASNTRAPRLVVLPFTNLSGDPGQEYLCDGLTEELIGQLAMLGGGLSVIARTSSMHYKGTRKSVAVIARELRVDYVLEGSLRRSGDHVRVTAQFIEAAGQNHVWANNYDGEVADLLRLQEEVAMAVAAEICCATSLCRAPFVSPRAYDAYLRWPVSRRSSFFHGTGRRGGTPRGSGLAGTRLLQGLGHAGASLGRLGFLEPHGYFACLSQSRLRRPARSFPGTTRWPKPTEPSARCIGFTIGTSSPAAANLCERSNLSPAMPRLA